MERSYWLYVLGVKACKKLPKVPSPVSEEELAKALRGDKRIK
jgi:hypothetical protein